MKFSIGNTVINSDHIVRVNRIPVNESAPKSNFNVVRCGIVMTDAESTESPYGVMLYGDEADRFWAVYSSDALDVMAGEAA